MSNDSATRTASERASSRLTGQPAPGETERTVGQLVADASHDISALVQSEIQLAKAEVTKGISFGGKGVASPSPASLLSSGSSSSSTPSRRSSRSGCRCGRATSS